MALFDSTFAPYVPFGSRTLSAGDTGTDVAALQAVYDLMLATMHPPEGPMGSPVPITGTFDAATGQAVRNIQSYFGLPATGVVDAATYFLFGQGVGPDTPYGGPAYGSRTLQAGAAGGDVRVLQNRLNCFRYAGILGRPADGVFDGATAAAVLAFKVDAAANGDTGFPSNSIVGFGFYDASWIYTFAGGRDLFPGRNGFDVVFLQVLLTALGFYAGLVDGYYGIGTRAAVEAFQAATGITVDGVTGPETFYQLGLNNPHPAPVPLAVAWPVVVPPPPSPPLPPLTRCATLLSPTVAAPLAYGLVGVISAAGAFSLDVTANRLPPPQDLGPPYTGYAFLVTSPAGTVLYGSPMAEIPTGSGSWAGHVDGAVLADLNGGTVVVNAASATGPVGPTVVSGPTCTPAA
ncbi:MAG: peptidoglycan-binding domain-containing protein [Firmicutes bacterium]|nr:peptidoglycan-binding domain-containing protein [Bacillota bacterium]